MRVVRLAAALAAAAGMALPAEAQVAFELESVWRQTVPYSSHEAWTFAEGGFWFQVDEFDVDDSGESTIRSARIERADAMTGERTVMASGPGLLLPAYVTPEYLVAAYGTPSVIDRRTGVQTGSGKASSETITDVMIAGKTIYTLRRRARNASGTYTDMFLSRFDIESMALLGETKLPHLLDHARFVNGEIIGIGATRRDGQPVACADGMTCHYTLFRTGLDGEIRSQLVLQAKKRPDAVRGCIATISLATPEKVFVDAGCGTHLAIDPAVTRVVYSLPWSDVDTQVDLAIVGDTLLVRPENATQMYGEVVQMQPVQAFDLETGKPLGAAMLPPGKLRTTGNKIVLATRSRESQIVVLVYNVSVTP